MIKLNQPGFKSFIVYVFSFIFLTLFTYLIIPFFFDYKNNKLDIEKKILNSFGLNLNLTSKAKYNIFPSPRLNLKNVEILSFSKNFNKIGSAEKVILKIPFKNLVNLNTLDFYSTELINSIFNIEISEINNFKNYLNNSVHEKPIKLKKSKINLFDKTNLIFITDLKKLNIYGNNLFNKANLVGQIFGTKIKINYQNKNFDENPLTKVMIGLPEIGLNLKFFVGIKEEKTDCKTNKERDMGFYEHLSKKESFQLFCCFLIQANSYITTRKD